MKATTSLTIDSEVLELAKYEKINNPSFSLSNIVNSYLKSYFNTSGDSITDDDIRELRDLKQEIEEHKEKQRSLKTKKSLMEAKMKKRENKEKEEFEKKYGKITGEIDLDETQ